MEEKIRSLYISYDGLLEEIVPSQVVPYLRGLTEGGKNIILLTFEKKQLIAKRREELCKIEADLKKQGIEWRWLRYHKRASLIATSFDVILGTAYAAYLVVARGIRIVHARSVVPAAMCIIPKLLGAKFIFDTRGILADEYVGGGQWKEGEFKFLLTKFFERLCLKMADCVIVLTQRHRRYLLDMERFKKRDISVRVIPCCVDLDRFRYGGPGNTGEYVFTYLGKIGTHYMFEEMMDFFKFALGALPNSKFMIITQSDTGQLPDICSRKGIDQGAVIVRKPGFGEIPSLIARSYAGIFFINPHRKFGSSPIKLGEFLSCGIPVIINSGIGDTEELVSSNRVGVVARNFNSDDYGRIIKELTELKKDPSGLSQRCRQTAEKFLSLKLGTDKYREIYRCLEYV